MKRVNKANQSVISFQNQLEEQKEVVVCLAVVIIAQMFLIGVLLFIMTGVSK